MQRVIDFIKSLLGIGESKGLKSDLWSVEDGKVLVKLDEMPELCEKGKGVYLKGHGLHKPILIVRTEGDQYLAYTNRCTHFLHRKLDPVPGPEIEQPILRCSSMNHSTFDYEGNRITGPGKESLICHQVERSNGNLLITLTVPAVEEPVVEPEAPEEPVAQAETAEEGAEQAEKAPEAAGQPEAPKEPVAQAETAEEGAEQAEKTPEAASQPEVAEEPVKQVDTAGEAADQEETAKEA